MYQIPYRNCTGAVTWIGAAGSDHVIDLNLFHILLE